MMPTLQNERDQRLDTMMRQYCETRDINTRNRLVEEYLYIAQIVARRFQGRGVEYDDLYQVASLALVKAMERFDPTRGVRFSTYATPTLIGEIKNYFRDRLQLVRLPRRVNEMSQHLMRVREELEQELSRTPSPTEIAARAEMSVESVLELIESGWTRRVQSLEQQTCETGDARLADVLGFDDAGIGKVEDRDYLGSVMRGLSDMEIKVLQARYDEERSQRDIAREMQVSQMYISRMERRMLDQFRAALPQGRQSNPFKRT